MKEKQGLFERFGLPPAREILGMVKTMHMPPAPLLSTVKVIAISITGAAAIRAIDIAAQTVLAMIVRI
jgi:hypothetical protein